jgi:hypothetical protein
VNGYMLGSQGIRVQYPAGTRDFLFSTASRLALVCPHSLLIQPFLRG